MLTAYAVPSELTSPHFCAALAQGLGAAYTTEPRLQDGDVALFGSPVLWDLLLEARDQGRAWFYGDHAYFGKRRYYRITRNAFMATGREPIRGGGARLARLGVEIQAWRRGGRHILVCPPGAIHGGLVARAGVAIQQPENWGAWARAELRKFTDRPIKTRTKDQARSGRPLEADLKDCWALVCFMSNVGVQAALAGIPVFVLGPAAARTVGCDDLSKIESPAYPDNRYEFACSLAAQQWTLEEIAAGEPREALACA